MIRCFHTNHRYFSMVADLYHVVLSCSRGEKAKRRHAKTRQMVTISCWRMATFCPATRKYANSMRCVFAYCLSYLCLAVRKVAMRKPAKVTIWRVFAWRPFAFSPRKHAYTTWHKSATIILVIQGHSGFRHFDVPVFLEIPTRPKICTYASVAKKNFRESMTP